MPRVVHFEFAADDPDRASAFYSDVFGWEIDKWGGPCEYWLAQTGEEGEPGIDGGIARRREGSQPTTVTLDVPSVDAFAANVEQAGGQVVVPKAPIPGVGWIAFCKDTEGNVFGIMEAEASAT